MKFLPLCEQYGAERRAVWIAAAGRSACVAGLPQSDTMWTRDNLDVLRRAELGEHRPRLRRPAVQLAAIDNAGTVDGPGMKKSYLIMMAARLLELRRVLKATASLYLRQSGATD